MPYPWSYPSYVVSPLSTITTRNNQDIKSIFGANVHNFLGLYLLGIGGAHYIRYKIMAQTYISPFLLLRNHKQMALHIMPEDSLNLGHHNLLKI